MAQSARPVTWQVLAAAGRAGRSSRTSTIAELALLASLVGCAGSIPKDRYGVNAIEVTGAEVVDEAAIEACLATHARERFGMVFFGGPTPQCGVPPFDAGGWPVELWAWPWTEWPLFNETAFERDLDRVERFYAARGYYDARVESAFVQRDDDAREVEIQLAVSEGEPVLIVRLEILGIETIDPVIQELASTALQLEVGEPFDEAFYERSKRAIKEALQEAGYASATVTGRVSLDPEKKLARVAIEVVPGRPCTFGDVTIEGNGDLPAHPIHAAAGIERGSPFSLSTLSDARLAVYRLGPFASVQTEYFVRPESPVVDVIVRVVPARMFRFGVGIGMTAGQETDENTGDSFAQWDVHLLGKIEHKNFLGGMRKLRVEDRPRLIFDAPFPAAERDYLGNLLTVELRQPAFAEARTTLVARARWDRGPDPYGGRFQRHDVVVGLGPERHFFHGKLLVSSSVNTDLFIPDQAADGSEPYPNTELAYLHHIARLDLRDDPRHTQSGSYFSLGLQHAGYLLPSDWDYVRITQDSRGYVRLPGRLVLALRARVGFMAVTTSRISVPGPGPDGMMAPNWQFIDNLSKLGPIRHRLRGGGHNSVRGYAPNTLGDVERIDRRLVSGGLRQWETSVELRVPITENFGTVAFVDAGDVSRTTSYRFDHPQTSLGVGLRYRTIVGPLRLDAAIAPADLQVFGPDERVRTGVAQSRLLGFADGALSFTIGEAF